MALAPLGEPPGQPLFFSFILFLKNFLPFFGVYKQDCTSQISPVSQHASTMASFFLGFSIDEVSEFLFKLHHFL